MDFRQFYLGCLSHASYYLGSGEECVIIDPQRDVEMYIAEAASRGQTIKYVIETHSHADFVGGHVELAARTGARIVFGQRANTRFSTLKVRDGDELFVGSVSLRFLETPGHTPEGISIIAQDTSLPRAPFKLFTGDTLFIGDVGRPDLVGSKGFTAEQMAGMLYDSLRDKILPLPDDTEIYPAHGAGSLCGKSLSKETWSTLGEQKRVNYALQPMSKDEFVRIVTSDQVDVPIYFPKSAATNLEGPPALADLEKPRQLTSDQVAEFSGVVIDVRTADEYGSGHLPNSINIGLGGQFASWAGTLIPIGSPIAVVAGDLAQKNEAVMRLARVGHETVAGYILIGDFAGHKDEIEQISVEEANDRIAACAPLAQFIDVRRKAEYDAEHANGAINVPLDKLAERAGEIDKTQQTYVICLGGYRSSIGTGILERAGVTNITNILGGTGAWLAAGLPTITDEDN